MAAHSTFFRATTPRFYKIILDDPDHDPFLPKTFVERYGHLLSNYSILLKVPTGAEWDVEIARADNGDLKLQNGWQQFGDYYSLVKGHFLRFSHEGMSKFSVTIFDMSATEIDYQLGEREASNVRPNKQGRLFREQKIKAKEDVTPIIILDDESHSKKMRRKEKIPGFNHSQIARHTFSAARTSGNAKKAPGFRVSVPPLSTQYESLEAEGSSRNGSNGKLKGREKSKAIMRAIAALKPRTPFFAMVAQPSYLPPHCKFNLPAKFAKEYCTESEGELILTDAQGNCWESRYLAEEGLGKWAVRLLKGWSQFAKDNNLRIEDVCIFEYLTGIPTITLRVSVYRRAA